MPAAVPVHPLKLAVTARGWTVRRLAEELGCNRNHLFGVIKGERKLSPVQRRKLLDLGFTPAELAQPRTPGLTAEQVEQAAADLVRRSCAAQGLPEQITDPAVLEAVARVLVRALADPSKGAGR